MNAVAERVGLLYTHKRCGTIVSEPNRTKQFTRIYCERDCNAQFFKYTVCIFLHVKLRTGDYGGDGVELRTVTAFVTVTRAQVMGALRCD